MRVRVEADTGQAADQRPRRFTLGERTIEVQEIVDRWYGERERYYRVRADDGDLYVLKYSEPDAAWELVSFTRKGSQGSNPDGGVDKTVH